MSLAAPVRPTTRTAAVVTRNEAVFRDLQRTLKTLGMGRVLHLAPNRLLGAPWETFWVIDGNTPGAMVLIQQLLADGRRDGVAVSTASASAFNSFCQRSGVRALLLHRDVEPAPVAAGPLDLTAREIQILALIAEGKSNSEIGQELHLSPLTIKSHLARMLRKSGAADRAHLVCLGLRSGLIV